MADPVSWMYIAGAMSAVGTMRQAQSQAQAKSYEAEVAAQNARIAQQQGEAAAELQAKEAQRKIGAMVAQYGAAGVDVSSGSPADVLADSVRSATLDNLTTKYNYQLKALGYTNQSSLDSDSASYYRTSGYFNAASDAVGTRSKIAYYKARH